MAYLVAPTDARVIYFSRTYVPAEDGRISGLISLPRPLVLGVLSGPPEPRVVYFSRTFRIAPPAEQQPGSGGTHAHGHA